MSRASHEEIRLRAIEAKLQDLRASLEMIEPIYRESLSSKLSLERKIRALEKERFNAAQVEFDFSASATF